MGLLALTPALTGCLVHTHSVLKTRPPDIVLSTSLDQLLNQVDDRYDAIQSMTATVTMSPAPAAVSKGEVTSTPHLQRLHRHRQAGADPRHPQGSRVGSDALDMVSDGKTFKMLIPPKNCAIIGSDVVTNTSQKGLYSLRPAVILDSLLIQGLQPDQVVAMTQDSRIVARPKTHERTSSRSPTTTSSSSPSPRARSPSTLRVIHISRVNLLPYQQDIYNADGKVATQAIYNNYQKFGDINFPTKIVIQRPLDELSLTITITKAHLQPEARLPTSSTLDIPDGHRPRHNMDDPASASIKDPCAVHAPQSPH